MPQDSKSVSASDAAPVEVISFAIGQEHYGVEIIAVREIKSWTNIVRLPNQPAFVRGVLNLRGTMVPIVDLRCRFGEGLTQTSPVHVVIVVQLHGFSAGILVDQVLDIVSIERAQIRPVPSAVGTKQATFLSGLTTVGDAMLALINLDRLVGQDAALLAEVKAA